MKRSIKFIMGVALIAALVLPVYQTAFAANECFVKYKTNTVKSNFINAGTTETINANNVSWIQNKKDWEVVVKITKMVPGIPNYQASGTKNVTLASNRRRETNDKFAKIVCCESGCFRRAGCANKYQFGPCDLI